jgi:hypothetical protein
MTTENGYMGWAPDNIYGMDYAQSRPGDLIAIVYGRSTPIAIRPHGTCYQILGEAYVQGLMDGEALEFVENGTLKVQDITFC